MSDTEHAPEAVAVLIASRDPLTVRLAAPIVAARLYPGRRFGRVLHIEDAEAPAPFAARCPDWSEAAVEVLP